MKNKNMYNYNAANTRTYKLSLYNTNLWINGQQQPLNMQLQQAMFYPNTYLNFNGNGEYTKHYYNGTERIASRLGDNTTTIALNNNILEDRKLSLEEHFRVDIHKLIYETVPIDMPPFMDVNALQPTGTPNDIYYYHPNHLGNTAFVTDQNQTIAQGFLYAPFGEITTEYNINFGNNVIPKYSFNAKELDEETGMYYYEARYYAPPAFTSRDPLFEKYFWMSPYAYCANNPVKYVDPSGEDFCNPDDPPKNKNQNNSKSSTTTTVGTSQTYNSFFLNVSISTSQTQGEQKLFNVDTKTSTETKTGEITSTTSYQFGKPQLNLSAEGGVSTSGSTTGKLNTTVVGIQTGIGLTSTQKIDDFQVTASLGYSNGEKSSNVAISVKPLRVAAVVTSALIVVASIATIHIPIVIPF